MDANDEKNSEVPDVNVAMKENPTEKDDSDIGIVHKVVVHKVEISDTLPKSKESSSGKESSMLNLDRVPDYESSHGWSSAEEKCQRELHEQLKKHRQELIEILQQHIILNKSLEHQVKLRQEVYGQITRSNLATSTSSSTLKENVDGLPLTPPEELQNTEDLSPKSKTAVQFGGCNSSDSSKALQFPDGDCPRNSSAVTKPRQPQRTISPGSSDDDLDKNINRDTKPVELPKLPYEDFFNGDRYSGDRGKRPISRIYSYKKGSKPVPKSDPESTDAEASVGRTRKSPIKPDGSSGVLEPIGINADLHSVPSIQNTPMVTSSSNVKIEDQETGTAQNVIDSAEGAVISTDTKPISIMNETRSLEGDVLTSPRKRHESSSPDITSPRKKQKTEDSAANVALHPNLRERETRNEDNSNRPPTVKLFENKDKECIIQ